MAAKYKAHAVQVTLLLKKTKLQNEKLKAELAQRGGDSNAELERQLTEARSLAEVSEASLRRLRTELENLQTQYYLVVADRDGLRVELDSLQAEADNLVLERDTLQMDLAELQAERQELESLKGRVEQQLKDLDFLHEELNDRDERLRSLEASSNEARLAAEARQDESLQVAEQLHQSLEEIATLKRQNDQRESQLQQLQQQYEHLQLSEEQLLAKIEELKYEREALQDQDDQAVVDLDQMQTRILDLEAELQTVRKQLEENKAQAVDAGEMARIQADLDTSNALLVELEIDLHARDQRIEQLLEELEKARGLNAEQSQQQLELEELRLLREDAESDSKLVTALQEQLDGTQLELEATRTQLTNLRKDYDQLRLHSTDNAVLDELRDQVAQFQEMLRERDEEHSTLLEQLEAQEIRFEELSNRSGSRDVLTTADLKEKIDDLELELKKMSEQKERLERDLEYARGKTEDQAEQLEVKDELNQSMREELESWRNRVENLELELNQHKSDLIDTRARLKERQNESDEASPEFQKKLARLEKKAAQTEKDLVETRARLLEAHNQMEPLETKRARAEAKAAILQRELSDALEQVTQLEQRLRDYEGEPEPPRRKKGKS